MIRVLSKREKVILYVTMGVVIFGLIFSFLISPFLNKQRNLNKEINLNRMKLSKYLLLLSQKDYLQEKYHKFLTQIKVAKSKEDVSLSVLSEIESLAKDADVRIVEIRPQGLSQRADLYPETMIDLRTQGTMSAYLKFIYDLENSPLLLNIKRFQLTLRTSTQTLEGSFSISQISLSD